jgi:DNA modification methylase
MSKRKQKSTKTSSFGSSGRISHDSSPFYNSRLYARQLPPTELEYHEQPAPVSALDRIFHKSSEDMSELPDNCVHLMITSPPYNVQKEYDEDMTLREYLQLLRTVGEETYRVLVTGGRACINIANVGRKPYIPLHAYIIQEMLDVGFFMRGEIIWDKASSAGASTAWGSWLSASNPVLRDVHEYILIFSKEAFSRRGEGKENTIDRDGFLSWTKSIWSFPTELANRVGHPAPFPEELPKRLIELYSYHGDVILDPFCGSGTTCVAALNCGRHYIGYEIDVNYVQLSRERIETILASKS